MCTATWTSYQNFRYIDPSGTVIRFPLYVDTGAACHTAETATSSGKSLDGTGFYAVIGTGVSISQVLAPDGTQVYPSLKDTNGNFFDADGSGNTRDTLNRTPLTSSTVGNQTTYTVNTGQGPDQVVVTTSTIYVHTAFAQSGVTEYQGHFTAITSIALPDGTSYQFNYDKGISDTDPSIHYGMLTSVTLPTGGVVSYGYTNFADAGGSRNRWVNSRTSGGGQWTYTPSTGCGTNCQKVTVNPPSGSQIAYTFNLNNGAWDTQTDYYAGAVGGTLLMTVQNTFDTSLSDPVSGGSGFIRTSQSTVTLPGPSGNLVKKTVYTYDTYTYTYRGVNYTGSMGNVLTGSEYAFGSGVPGALTRKTVYTYVSGTNIVNDAQVQTSAGTKIGETAITFDSTTLTAASGFTHHDDTNYGIGFTARHNPTVIKRWITGTSYLNTTLYYDTTGQVTSVTDPKGNATNISYAQGTCSSSYQNAYPTQITNALSQLVKSCYDFNTGLVTSTTDANNQSSTFTYDNLNRPLNSSFPGGGCTNITYISATARNIYTCLTGTTQRQDQITMDPLGRVTTSALISDPEGTDFVGTTYDTSGRVASISNPYRRASNGSESFAYDGLGRSISVTHEDGNVAHFYYGAAVATNGGRSTQLCSAVGYPTLSVDEAGKKRQSWTDAFGRTVETDEPDTGGAWNWGTCYTYDLLDNLTNVTQGAQTRTYAYDALSRLTSVTTPETFTTPVSIPTNFYYTTTGGALCSGNPSDVCRRTDARAITTTYTYDTLNRLTSKTYSDGTPAASFFYDETSVTLNGTPYTLTNPKGRLTHTSAAGGTAMTIHSYDVAGRAADFWQCAPYNCTSTSLPNIHYTYDQAGDITSWTHPGLGATVVNEISTAQRITLLRTGFSDATQPGTLGTFTYNAAGQIATLVNGCAGTGCVQRQETYDYNNRLQVVRIQLGTAASPAANNCVVYNYYSSVPNPTSCSVPTLGTGNNGIAMGYFFQDTTNPTQGHSATYSYDPLNRLATSVATGSQTHNLTFSSDRYGNMTCVTNGSTNGPCGNWTFNTVNNHISNTGFSFDLAGNLTADGTGTGTHTFQWDGESRLASVDTGTTATYTYNAFGQRVEKNVGGSLTEYFYNAFGQVIYTHNGTTVMADYFPVGSSGFNFAKRQASGARFLHGNALGTVSTVTDYAGATLQDEIYYPWGQRWSVVGSTLWGERFASLQERDAETTTWQDPLDPTPNRTYTSGLGRWMSPDPIHGTPANPQSWNRYAYVVNNPTNLTDPLGLCPNLYQAPSNCQDDHGGMVSSYGSPSAAVAANTPGYGSGGFNQFDAVAAAGGAPVAGYGEAQYEAQVTPTLRLWVPTRYYTSTDSKGQPVLGVVTGHWEEVKECFGGDAFCNSAGKVVGIHGNIESDDFANMAMAGAARAAALVVKDIGQVQASRLFGTRYQGNVPVFNTGGYFRIGWSYDTDSGRYVFRISGNILKDLGFKSPNPHINFWPPSWWGGKPGQ